MTEYAYSRKEPCISSTTSMSRIFSSYQSSGGGVFVLRRAIAAGSLLKRERDLTRTIVDRGTDNADQDPTPGPRPGVHSAAVLGAGAAVRHDCPQATRSAVGVCRPGTSPGLRTLAYSGRTAGKRRYSTTASAIE